MNWDENAKAQFDRMIEKVPIFLRDMARERVSKKAEKLVVADGRSQITQKDMVDAFFAETPFGFHGPMKSDMESLGIDYARYGHGQ